MQSNCVRPAGASVMQSENCGGRSLAVVVVTTTHWHVQRVILTGGRCHGCGCRVVINKNLSLNNKRKTHITGVTTHRSLLSVRVIVIHIDSAAW